MKKNLNNPIIIQEGTILTLDTITWHDPYWEFDFPSAIIRPIFRGYESGKHHDQIIEDICIDAVCDSKLENDNFEQTWGWRGYSLKNLKRVFREAFNGKDFPKLGYRAQRTAVKFIKDKRGELTWEELSVEKSLKD